MVFKKTLDFKLKDYSKVNRVLRDLTSKGAMELKKWKPVGLRMVITLNLQELRILRNALLSTATSRSNELTSDEQAEYKRLAGYVLYE